MEALLNQNKVPEKMDPQFESKFNDTLIIGAWLIGKSEKTKQTYKKIIKMFFEFHPRISIQTTTTAHITVFLKDLENRGSKSTTLNLYKNALGSLFKSAVKQRRLEQDPTSSLSNYRIQDTIYQKILDIDQVKQMILKEKRQRNVMLLKVLFYLGLRVSEITEILVSDFTFRKDGVVLNVKGKGSKIRQAPIGENLWLEIEEYITTYELRPSDFLFNDEITKNRKISTVSIWKSIRASSKRAKIVPMPSPHWFRHTCATLSLEGGAPVHVVQARLGHASLAT
jgi:integrase/recombinase XerD